MFRRATTTAATTAKHALKSRARAPLSNSRNTRGRAAGSCHPLRDSLPSSTSFFQSSVAHFLTIAANHFSTPHLLRRQRRAAICHPGTGRCHPAGCLPYTAVMASGSPRKISNRQKKRQESGIKGEGGLRARDQRTLAHIQAAPTSPLLDPPLLLFLLTPLWPGRFARYFSE